PAHRGQVGRVIRVAFQVVVGRAGEHVVEPAIQAGENVLRRPSDPLGAASDQAAVLPRHILGAVRLHLPPGQVDTGVVVAAGCGGPAGRTRGSAGRSGAGRTRTRGAASGCPPRG